MTATALPAESIDDRIARLERELLEAKEDKVGDDIGHFAHKFLDFVPDYWEKDKEHPTLEEMESALGFVCDAWKRFETWRTAWADDKARIATTRPYLALALQDGAGDGNRRAPGAGSVYASGNGFKWRVTRDGKLVGGKTWPTRQEAETELALVLADPAFVPASADRKRLLPTSKHHCSHCGSADHRAPCPRAEQARAATKCGTCGHTGHNARTCQKRADHAHSDDEPTNDDALNEEDAPVPSSPAPPRDQEALARRDRLVTEGLEMAKKIAANHTRRSSTRVGMADDIHSAALEGLVRAADAYDPTLGVPFTGYAYQRVTGAVLDFFRDQDHLSRDDRAKVKAGNVDLPPAPVSFEQLAEDVGDRIPDHSAADPSHVAEGAERIAAIERASESLPERHREVLRLRYSRGLLLTQIGERLGVTESRVCQMLKEAHAQLREILGVASPFVDDVVDEDESPREVIAVPVSNVDYVHPGRGWGPVDASGYAVHILCNGTGQIRIKKLVRGCFPCEGTGRRACVKR